MPHVDINELKNGRKEFDKDEWVSEILRSIGMEPDNFTYREKWASSCSYDTTCRKQLQFM